MRRAGNESEPKFPTQVVSRTSDSPSSPIIETFGYSPVKTQLFSVPPWAVSFVFAMLIATFSDLAKHRFLFVIFPLLVALAGFPTPPGTKNDHPTQHGTLFLAVSGVYSVIPVIVYRFNNNCFMISIIRAGVSISGWTLVQLHRNWLENRIREPRRFRRHLHLPVTIQ